MVVATVILILSAAMFFFYFQVTCQKILRRQFIPEYYQSVVKANHLEFLLVRNSLEGFGGRVAHSSLRHVLRCDFLALTYLLKNAGNVKQRYSYDERLLMLYFHWGSLSLAIRRTLRLGEKPAILRLTSILQYFANVVGERVDALKLGDLNAAG